MPKNVEKHSSLRHILGQVSPKISIICSYFWTYDLYGAVCNAFDAGKYITRASGKWWAWSKMEQSYVCIPCPV